MHSSKQRLINMPFLGVISYFNPYKWLFSLISVEIGVIYRYNKKWYNIRGVALLKYDKDSAAAQRL